MWKRSLEHRNMGSLEVVGDATEEWNLLVVDLGVIPEKKKGIDFKIERQRCMLSCLAALVDFVTVDIQVSCSSCKDVRVIDAYNACAGRFTF